MFSPRIRRCALAVVVFMPAAGGAFAQSNGTAEAVARRLDPTDFKTRFETRYEYQSLQSGGARQLVVPRYEHAFSRALSLRFDLPYVVDDSPSRDVDDEHGIGDMTVRPALRVHRSEAFSLVTAAEFILDTASDERLGTGKNVVAPLVYASFGLPRFNSVLFPYAQHYVSVSGDDERNDINQTLLRLGLLTRWPRRFYSFLEPSLYVDWERDQRTGFTLELEVGRFATSRLALWARPGVGLWGDNLPPVYNWNFEVGFRYFLD